MKGKFIGSPKKGAGSGWHAVHNIDYLKPQIGDSEIASIRSIGIVLEDRAGSAGKCSGNVAMVRVQATDFLWLCMTLYVDGSLALRKPVLL